MVYLVLNLILDAGYSIYIASYLWKVKWLGQLIQPIDVPNLFDFCRIFEEYEDHDFARTGTIASEKVIQLQG